MFSPLFRGPISPARRVRGALLRVSRRRPVAMAIGAALAAPAAWIEVSGRYEAWWLNGLALVGGATGIALFWNAVSGARPDWVDSDSR